MAFPVNGDQGGDLLKIDTACKLNGWCADAAVTLNDRRG